jgi:hypothetical protein
MEIILEDNKFKGKYIFKDLIISELEEIIKISNKREDDNYDFIDKYVDILEIITDIPKDLLEKVDIKDLHILFTKFSESVENEIKTEFILNDKTYKIFNKFENNEIKIYVAQHKVIKRAMKASGSDFIGELAAAFFMESDDTLIKDKNAYKERVELFRNNMTVDYIMFILSKFINSVAILQKNTLEAINNFK